MLQQVYWIPDRYYYGLCSLPVVQAAVIQVRAQEALLQLAVLHLKNSYCL
jgi:hypothetical protein